MVKVENKVQRYEKYKDSGVEWLGKIPEHWQLGRLGSILNPVSSKNHPKETLLSITREKGVIVRDIENEDSNHNFIPDDLTGYKLLKKDQFGMNKMKAWQGSYGVSSYTGIVSPAYYTFEFTKEIEPRFFHIAIRSKMYVSFFGKASDGVRIGQWDLSKDRMKRIPLAVPPLPEQTAIAQFLDDKTTKIDAAIAIKEQQINLLKERKQILIHKAVTRGLDDGVPLKDSGVEWIGEIPEGWEMFTLKKMISTGYIQFQDGNHGGDYPRENEFSEIGVPFIKPRDMQNGEILFESSDKLPLERALKLRIGFAKKGDTLMVNRGGSIGKTCFVTDNFGEQDFFIINPQVTYLRPLKNLNSKYLNFLCESNIIQVAVDMILGYGSTFSFLGLGNMGEFPIPVPPLSEQKEISAYIETASQKIETAIALKQQEIEKLKEYKGSLINGVVTGKVRVC